MKSIRVYHTHIEIEPYTQGENFALERSLSIRNKITKQFMPLAFMVENNIMYLPRGVDINILKHRFRDAKVTVYKEHDKVQYFPQYEMTKPVLGKIEEDSIDFLSAEGNFKKARTYSQLSLNIDTGDGKTYSTIASILRKKEIAIVITHKNNIKNQWLASFNNLTTVPKDKVINIESSAILDKIMKDEIRGYVYLVNHQTLASYAKSHSWGHIGLLFTKLGIGRKVFDEAHKHFANILRVDRNTNTKTSIYLTATFERGKYDEKKVFELAFANVYRFGEETYNYEEKKRHITYIALLYDSHATSEDVFNMKTKLGLSPHKFIEYALEHDTSEALRYWLMHVIERVSTLEGKILITTPKINSSEIVKSMAEEILPNRKISTIHSRNSEEDNEESKKSDVISSTLSSFDSGTDVPGLRVLINAGPHSSTSLTSQLPGRLRKYIGLNNEYPDGLETFYIDLIDVSIPECYDMYKRRQPVLKKKCKKVLTWNKC